MKNLLLKFYIFGVFLIIPCFAYANEGVSYDYVIEQVKEKKLYEYKEWKDLLHYHNGKSYIDETSGFFLSQNGKNSPEDEMYETIDALFNKYRQGNDRLVCEFPARAYFIAKELGIYSSKFEPIGCVDYENFAKKVPIDDISIIFASENNEVPTSIMGHIFLKFSGVSEGLKKEHAFSYFAVDPDTTSPSFYINVVASTIDGMYYLTPYSGKRDRYLYEEQRSIWEVDLALSDEQITLFKKHVWELKKQDIGYSFIFHNCGTAVESLLNILYPNQRFSNKYKLFETPVDYVLYLSKQGYVKNINLIPSPEYELKQMRTSYLLSDFYLGKKDENLVNALKNYNNSLKNEKLENRLPVEGYKTQKKLLDSKHSSKISLGYRHFNKDSAELEFMPLYQDISDVSKSMYDDMSTKILSFNLRYDDDLYINSIDLINTRSIVDASYSYKAISKHMKLSLENSIGRTNTAIKPVAELGAGYAYDLFNQTIKPYFLPKMGYRYDDIHNFYFVPEVGMIIKPVDDIKLIGFYEKYLNSKQNNVGFTEKYSATLSYNFVTDYSLYVNYNKYSGVDSGLNEEVRVGLGLNF